MSRRRVVIRYHASTLRALPPDETSLKHCTYVMLKPCPFCGAEASPPFDYVNDTGSSFSGRTLYQTRIECRSSRCGAGVFDNEYTRDDARAGAIAKWQDRRPARERLSAEELARSPARRW